MSLNSSTNIFDSLRIISRLLIVNINIGENFKSLRNNFFKITIKNQIDLAKMYCSVNFAYFFAFFSGNITIKINFENDLLKYHLNLICY